MASTPQDFSPGLVLTDTMMDKLPQGILDKQVSTSNVGPTSGTTSLDVLTSSAVTLLTTNRRLRLRFHVRGYTPSVSGDTFILRIQEGATVLSDMHIVTTSTTGTFGGVDFDALVDSPTAAAHTYKVTVTRAIGSGTITLSGTATGPITFTVEDAGQA